MGHDVALKETSMVANVKVLEKVKQKKKFTSSFIKVK